ncbi:MAG: glycine zipper 2TM domain-containing protein [Gammaproteobacteria bacterium]|nr:glycine zipper 2TM domain-containing protein [Gammaproteobacteria bacterium]
MKKALLVALSSTLVVGLVGCQNSDGTYNKQDIGLVSGAVLGGLVGSRFGGGTGQLLATGAGAVVGAWAGSQIGKSMDQQDKMNMQGALSNVDSNKTVAWNNDQGVHYTFTPTTPTVTDQTSVNGTKRYCREFIQTATIEGKQQQMYGKACRQEDGSWQVVDSKEQ